MNREEINALLDKIWVNVIAEIRQELADLSRWADDGGPA